MKIQRFNALTIFVLLINMIHVSGMEKNYEALALQTAEYNETHPLLCLLHEVQQQIAFPYTTRIAENSMSELNQAINTLFVCKCVCRYFSNNLRLPWSGWKHEEKNKILKDINQLFIYRYYGSKNNINNFLAKLELLPIIPDMVNLKNDWGRTPINLTKADSSLYGKQRIDEYEKIIALLRKCDSKNARELE